MAGENNTLNTQSGIPWSDLINAGLAWWMSRGGGGAGSTPNTYNIPLSPEDKYWDDQRKKMFEAGGSDVQKQIRAAGTQFLSQVPSGPSNFSFMSPHMKNQSFAGGIKMPTFDMSAFMPSNPTVQRPDQPAAAQPFPPTDRPRPNDIKDETVRQPPRDFGNESGFPTPNPNALRDITENNPTQPTDLSRVASAWEQFKKEHPNWAQLGVSAVIAGVAGLAGPVAGGIMKVGEYLRRIFMAGGAEGGSGWPNNNDAARQGVTVSPGDPIPEHGMPFDPNFPGTGRGRFEPTPIPRPTPWDTGTYGGNRQRQIADDFANSLKGPDIFDENQRNSSFAYGGRALM